MKHLRKFTNKGTVVIKVPEDRVKEFVDKGFTITSKSVFKKIKAQHEKNQISGRTAKGPIHLIRIITKDHSNYEEVVKAKNGSDN